MPLTLSRYASSLQEIGRDYRRMLERADTNQYSNFDAHENENLET
jgi:hypothetical protein